MYKGIKRLIEGLFDDDTLFNDRTLDDEINDIKNSIYTYDNLINKLISIIKHFLINDAWRRYKNIDTL